jgi:hypothetical protein
MTASLAISSREYGRRSAPLLDVMLPRLLIVDADQINELERTAYSLCDKIAQAEQSGASGELCAFLFLLGTTRLQQHDYAQAEEIYTKLLHFAQAHFGIRHISIAIGLNALSYALALQSKTDLAMESVLAALKICDSNGNQRSILAMRLWTRLSEVRMDVGQLVNAECSMSQALEILDSFNVKDFNSEDRGHARITLIIYRQFLIRNRRTVEAVSLQERIAALV